MNRRRPLNGGDGAADPERTDAAAGVTGNRARDHLANERTYLAWLRTALAVVAAGAVMAKLTGDEGATTAAAAGVTVGLGVTVLVYGTVRYYRVARGLDEDLFRPAGRGPLLVALGCLVALAAVLPLLLV